MLVRVVTATACLAAAGMAVAPPAVDVRALEDQAALYPARRISLLTEARSAHPRDTTIGLALGLEFERRGDARSAETILLETARLDRQYQPAWTLANFYFRRENASQFWVWSARAASLATDLRPLLRLAAVREPEPRALIARLGDRPELLRPYLDLLIGEARWCAAEEVAGLLAAHHDPADMARFEAFRKIRSAGTC